jgi:hypothetical protein
LASFINRNSSCSNPAQSWLASIVVALTLASAAQDSETVLKVDVKLVNVFVTVTDEHGGPVASGTPVGGPIPVSDNEWNGFALQPEGRELAVGGGSKDGIAIWDLDPQDWVDAACRLAGRNLTKAEWDTYLGTLGDYHATCA